MLHPHTEIRFISADIGHGVVATALIPKGTIVWALDGLDQILAPAREQALPEVLRGLVQKYAFVDGRGQRILCWDHARFVNHSCRANCFGPGLDFELAIRDIHPGEELLDDYGGLNLAPFRCCCGTMECRGMVLPHDIVALSAQWDSWIEDAFRQITAVEQPLWSVLNCQDEVRAVLEGRAGLRSTREHYFARSSAGSR
jgi:hypothetical protein